MTMPNAIIAITQSTCAERRKKARVVIRSSIKETREIRKLEATNPRKYDPPIMTLSAIRYTATIPTKKVATMAIPPDMGTGISCDERWFGLSNTNGWLVRYQHTPQEKKNSEAPKRPCGRKTIRVI